MPGPRSATTISVAAPVRTARTDTAPPSPPYLIALSSRFDTAWNRRLRSPSTTSTGAISHSIRWPCASASGRSEEHTSELQSLMRISYAVFCLKKKKSEQHQPADTDQQQECNDTYA